MPKFPKLKINAGSSPVEVVMGCRGKLTAFVPSIKEQGEEKLICMECGKHHNEHFVQRMSCVNIFWHKELNQLVSALMKIADIPNHPDLVPTSDIEIANVIRQELEKRKVCYVVTAEQKSH